VVLAKTLYKCWIFLGTSFSVLHLPTFKTLRFGPYAILSLSVELVFTNSVLGCMNNAIIMCSGSEETFESIANYRKNILS